MVAFMDTTATIPTGAMAERWKWNAFVGWGLFCGAIYYPLFGAWTWGGGWLAKLGQERAPRATATSTSPAPASCTRWVASPASPARSCSVLASASTARTASRERSGRTTSRWRCSARSSCCSAGSASTPRRRLSATDIRFAVIATNTAIAAAFGAVIAMFWIDGPHRQARPGDDGQRHARRPGRDHRAVRVRAALGGGGASASSPASSSSSRCGSSSARRRSTTRSARSRCTACAASGACLCVGHLRRRPVRPGLERHRVRRRRRTASPASSTAARAGASSAPRPSVRSPSSS